MTDQIVSAVRSCTPTLSVGVVAADLMHLDTQLQILQKAGVTLLHFDVMDGAFVPMLTVGPPFIKAVKTSMIKDVHLLINAPEKSIRDYVQAGADIITVHIESTDHAEQILRDLATAQNANDPERGVARGVAINPATPLETLLPLLEHMEILTVLAIDPNVKGQGFQPETFERMARIKEMLTTAGRDILLCVDGGVKKENIGEIAAMGADVWVSGSAVFSGGAIAENVKYMMDKIRQP